MSVAEMAQGAARPLRIVVVVPVCDDWQCARSLAEDLDRELSALPAVEARLLLVDDGSRERPEAWPDFAPRALSCVQVLALRRNLGHQRAIAVGLCHTEVEQECDAVLVMDADGEDRPVDVRRLIDEFRQTSNSVVFAERRKRLESRTFRLSYLLYRVAHRTLTGVSVRVGNFSIVPLAALGRLVVMAELWNHYAGAVFRSRVPYRAVPIDRGTRYFGKSKMGGFVPLVLHGIAGIATFYDIVATRLLLLSLLGLVACGTLLAVVVALRFGTDLAIPGWATYSAGLLLVLSAQAGSVAFSLVLSLVATRLGATFVPARDYRAFVNGVSVLSRAPALGAPAAEREPARASQHVPLSRDSTRSIRGVG
ncbi:MAG TPA: glycosyltransferase [Polyangiaceae bacterium]